MPATKEGLVVVTYPFEQCVRCPIAKQVLSKATDPTNSPLNPKQVAISCIVIGSEGNHPEGVVNAFTVSEHTLGWRGIPQPVVNTEVASGEPPNDCPQIPKQK